MTTVRPEQPALPGMPRQRARPLARAARTPAEVDPVASVQLDAPVPHLDREFDYLVPAELADEAVPGVRVRVSLAGRQLPGFVVARKAASEHEGQLRSLGRVVSSLPVLTEPVLTLAHAVAERYAGCVSDVLRLAVPPRHGTVEKAVLQAEAAAPLPYVPPEQVAAAGRVRDAWSVYRGGAAFLRRVAEREAPWGVWSALPWRETGPGEVAPAWPDLIAGAVHAAVTAGRGAVVVLPTMRDVARLEAALAQCGIGPNGGVAGCARLVAEDGPSARYRSFLAVLTGRATVAIGTRAAAYAPVRDPGLLVLWDEANPLHVEPRAPYPHARTVLQLRARIEHSALLLAGHTRSVAAQQLVEQSRAGSIQAERTVLRAGTPRMAAPTATDLARYGAAGTARIPPPAWHLIEQGLKRGPVLVQVPRAGYTPVLACASCGQLARCPVCGEQLTREGPGLPVICPTGCEPEPEPQPRAKGGIPGTIRSASGFRCPNCASEQVRAVRVGAARLAEELGRGFPGTVVRHSGTGAADGVIDTVPATPALVIATQGAEPWAPGGYSVALCVDGQVISSRPELQAGEEALRRWLAAAALTRPAGLGGHAMLLGQPAPAPAGAFVRWDPVGFASRELAERRVLGLTPTRRIIQLTGPRPDVREFLTALAPGDDVEVLGPFDVAGRRADGDVAEAQLRVPLQRAADVVRDVAALSRVRSARRARVVRVQVDPPQ